MKLSPSNFFADRKFISLLCRGLGRNRRVKPYILGDNDKKFYCFSTTQYQISTKEFFVQQPGR